LTEATAADMALDVPAGFVPYPPASAFMALFGPMYARHETDGTTTIGLRLAAAHQNHQGTAHGGMLAAIADNSLGYNVARAMGRAIATVHMSIDYLGRSSPGDWLEVSTVIDRQGRRMCFAHCTAAAQGRPVMKTSAVFSVL